MRAPPPHRQASSFHSSSFRCSERLVGAPRFELGTPCTPCKCATGRRHAPTGGRIIHSASQDLEDVLELGAQLSRELLTLRDVLARLLAFESVARAADRESLFVEQSADLANHQHVLPLVVAP